MPITFQVLNDGMRSLRYRQLSLFPCLICSLVYHDGCLCFMDYLQNNNAMEVMEMAHTKMGQNCYLLCECLEWGTLGFCWVLPRELCPLWIQAVPTHSPWSGGDGGPAVPLLLLPTLV